jgi:flagellar hook-associated protein 1 FlgK
MAALNVEISRVRSLNNEPNDLLDERDRILDRLTEITGVQSYTQENGETIVSLGGHVLVVGSKANALTTVVDPANSNLTAIEWADDGLSLNVMSGELEGLFDARDVVIVDQMTAMDDLAQTLHDQVNQLHIHGYSINNPMGFVPPPPPAPLPVDATAYNFFDLQATPGSIASRLILDSHITDPTDGLGNIAAAAGPGYAPGDGNQALAIANLQTALVLNANSTSMNDFYTQQIADLGLQVSHAKNTAADHSSIMDSLEQSRDDVSGVSSDEEATKLLESTKAYNSAARVLTAIDDMLDRVINNMGRVGI